MWGETHTHTNFLVHTLDTQSRETNKKEINGDVFTVKKERISGDFRQKILCEWVDNERQQTRDKVVQPEKEVENDLSHTQHTRKENETRKDTDKNVVRVKGSMGRQHRDKDPTVRNETNEMVLREIKDFPLVHNNDTNTQYNNNNNSTKNDITQNNEKKNQNTQDNNDTTQKNNKKNNNDNTDNGKNNKNKNNNTQDNKENTQNRTTHNEKKNINNTQNKTKKNNYILQYARENKNSTQNNYSTPQNNYFTQKYFVHNKIWGGVILITSFVIPSHEQLY